jgi:hypothetical protein
MEKKKLAERRDFLKGVIRDKISEVLNFIKIRSMR